MKIIKASTEILTKVDGNEVLKMIEAAGRTCYKSEDSITEDSAKKFVQMLINRGHEAMIEHYNITAKFICDRGVSHEIVRHRVASYAQESTRYCLAGDTKLYFNNPHLHMTIADLYNNKNNSNNGSWKRLKIKQLNEDTGFFQYIKIKDIYFNGRQKTFKIKTKLGYELMATKDHQIHTDKGFKKVQDVFIGNKISVNGILLDLDKPLYQNKEWLFYHYNTLNKTSVQIENEFGFNQSTIKKWVTIHKLPKKQPSYFNKGREPWNKGLSEIDDKRVFNQAEALRNYHWCGGNSNTIIPKNQRVKKLSIYTYRKTQEGSCLICNSEKNLQVHHLDEDRNNNELENLFTICKTCHMQVHNKNLKFLYFDEIVSITPCEIIDVYDLSVDSKYKNYIANGVVVHNCDYNKDKFGSQITYIQPCWFDGNYTNLSSDELNTIVDTYVDVIYSDHDYINTELEWLLAMSGSEDRYKQLTNNGWKAQEARSVLPNSLKTEIIMTANLREWRHFFKLRTAKVAHPQMIEVATMLLNQMKEMIPVVFDDIII